MTTLFPELDTNLEKLITQKIRRSKEEKELPIEERTIPQVHLDIWERILNDAWMYNVFWGQPRTGKSTAALQAAYDVYGDWDKVLQSIVFTLPSLMYKMQKDELIKIKTLNGLHNRIPLLIGDDWAAHNNKARTKQNAAFDVFKGAFDVLATKIACFLVTMNNPSGITEQLQTKYTHEVYVETKGLAKYDEVHWQQNYYGWAAKQKKTCMQEYYFKQIPTDVYTQYDEMRLALGDELIQAIHDAMMETEGIKVYKRLNNDDVEFIELIVTNGPQSNDWINKPENYKYKEVLTRCKSRTLVTPIRKGSNYWYDLTDFGWEVYTYIQAEQQKGKTLPDAITRKTQETHEDAT